MKLPLKQSKYLRVTDGIWCLFIRWAYHKYLDELYIPEGTTVTLGHGFEDISSKHGGYGKTVSLSSSSFQRKGVQEHHFVLS